MASTISSKTTSKTKKVAGKTIKTTTDETTIVSVSDTISLDKNRKKAEALIAKLVRNREAIADLEKEKAQTQEELYELMGWEKKLVGDTEKWVGVATKGTINGGTRITISRRTRTEVDKKKLEADFAEVFAKVMYQIDYTAILTK